MISRKTEELQAVMDKLKSIIENKQTIEVKVDYITLSHFHDAVLLTKILREKATNLDSLKTNLDEVAAEISEMNADYISEAEDLVYCVFDALLEDKVKVE